MIFGLWMVWKAPQPASPDAPAPEATTAADEPEETEAGRPLQAPTDSAFAAALAGENRPVVVETDLYRAVFSTQGATLRSFQLKRYRRAGVEAPVELVADTAGALGVVFAPPQGSFVDTRALHFRAPATDTLRVASAPAALVFEAPVGNGALRLTYGFAPDSYEVTLRVEAVGTDVLERAGGYELAWNGAIPLAEDDPEQEVNTAGAYLRSGGETDRRRLSRAGEAEPIERTGRVDWVAVKTKYFAAVLLPGEDTEGGVLEGARRGEPGLPGFDQHYAARLQMPRLAQGDADAFRLYLGPMDLQRLAAYQVGLYDMVDFGFGETLTRPIAQFVIAPSFALLSSFIPSYGIVIILFALLVKIVLWPLTRSSLRSAAKMRELAPKMEALKERYADNPQKQQEEMMSLYRSEGVNPLGGCLPMLLQYPILIALWQFFQSTLVLRQESFLWARDLSAPDVILELPFPIPLYGDFVAGFTLLMGISMILQMKLSMPAATGPQAAQQKVFLYVLPAMFFLFFNRLPAGLSLYYLAFNVFSIVQQRWTNQHLHAERAAKAAAGASPPSRNGRPSANGRPAAKAGAGKRAR